MLAEILLPLPLDQSFHYLIPEGMSFTAGQRVSVPFGKRLAVGYVAAISDEAPPEGHALKIIQGPIDQKPMVGPEALDLAGWLSRAYACSRGEAMSSILPLAVKESAKSIVFPQYTQIPNHQLTSDQQTAYDAITRRMGEGYGAFLMHGVTDSGKTEVYLHAIQHALRLGKSAIFLLPEIALTPQFIGTLRARLNCPVAVWHSKLSPNERSATWTAVRDGKVPVMVGTRSCVFAPFAKLGLIVIDEEHESSYKQQQRPMYHAREVALERAKIHGACVVMGSATPTLESYWRAKQKEFELLELKDRVAGRSLPPVHVVDQTKEREGRKLAVMSQTMIKALEQRLAKREQAILLMNRRGHSPFVICQDCGVSVHCSSCAVTMVYHKQENQLLCHYCGRRDPVPQRCPACRGGRMRLAGVGTEKVVDEVIHHFPYARVLRMDRDVAKGKHFYEQAYAKFSDEEYDILVGTQMVAKGFHFPRVTLVGVVDADTALHIPDFRAAERTFQLITQVAGRPGRSQLGGEVIIQTYHPNHYAIDFATRHDYGSFFIEELKYRRELRYPPFARLCNMLVHGTKQNVVADESRKLAAYCSELADRMHLPTEVIGPTPALRPLLRARYRYQILMKGAPQQLAQLAEGLKSYKAAGGVKFTLDMDPVNLL